MNRIVRIWQRNILVTSWACVAGIFTVLGDQQVSGLEAGEAGHCEQWAGQRHHLAVGRVGRLQRVEISMAPFGRDCVEGRDDVAKDKTPRSSHTLQPLPHHQWQDHRCRHQERWGIAAYLTRRRPVTTSFR